MAERRRLATPGRNARRRKLPQGRYANYLEVGHNPYEFILDFGQYHPETEEAQLHTRIVTGPAYAKLLTETLNGAVSQFEEEHGVIDSARDEIDPIELVQRSIEGYGTRLDDPAAGAARSRTSTARKK
jgi:hypothetical protein